jgi:hypothetical protein
MKSATSDKLVGLGCLIFSLLFIASCTVHVGWCLFAGTYQKKEPKVLQVEKKELVNPEIKLKEKLVVCQKQYERLSSILTKIDLDRTVIVQRLESLGIKSKDDLKGNEVAKVIAEELFEIIKRRDLVKKDCEDVNLRIEKIGSVLRRLARQTTVDGTIVSEQELDEMLSNISSKLDDTKIKSAESVEIGDILDKELKSKE